jgi:hypothetical protein
LRQKPPNRAYAQFHTKPVHNQLGDHLSRPKCKLELQLQWTWLAATLGANFGRDTDTVACMAAGICGALSGFSPESAELIDCLSDETRRAQVDLASRLATLARTKMESELKAIARCPAGVS